MPLFQYSHWHWIIVKLILILLLVCIPFTLTPKQPAPMSKNGVFDARSWHFATQSPLELVGEWRFQWQHFAAPESQQTLPHIMKLPSVWNGYRYNGTPLPGSGYASYQITILIEQNKTELALLIPDFYGAGKLWVNGKLAAEIGTIATHKADELTIDTFQIIPLPNDTKSLNLMFHTSSFHHRFGGIYKPFKIGSKQKIESVNNVRLFTSITFIGGSLCIALFLLGVYVSRISDKSYFFAAMTLYFMALRTLGVEKIWMNINTTTSADWLLRFEYIGWIGGAYFFLLYISSLFPKQSPRWFIIFVSIITLISTVIILTTPSEQYVYLRDIWHPLTLSILICELIITTRAEKQNISGARFAGAAMALISIPVIHDIILYAELYPVTYWNSIGHYTLFALGPSTVAILVYRINTTTRSEARLTQELKTINTELQQRVEERTSQLAHKIEELNVLHQQAEQARAIAEEAKQKRTEFLGLMAHEIRTPLSGIKGSLELVKSNVQDHQNQLLIENASQSTSALLEIVNDALDLSSIDAGRFELKPKPFAIAPWLEAIYELMSIPIQEKQLQFNFKIDNQSILPVEDITVNADSGRLRQVLINLLNNACKFTQSGHVLLKVNLTPDKHPNSIRCYFLIEDTGIGISEDELSNIFLRYHQIDTSHSKQFKGAGLGLNISDQIISTMGGQIHVESQVQQGSRFSFELTLPLKPLIQPASAQHIRSKPIATMKLLIVEDDKTNRDVLAILLQQEGHSVVTAHDGIMAIDLFSKHSFDVVLTDIRLPTLSGIELTQKLRQMPNGNVPIIAITANVNKQDIAQYYAAGIDSVLAKPVSKSKIDGILSNLSNGKLLDTENNIEPISKYDINKFDDENLITLKKALGKEGLNALLLSFKESRAKAEIELREFFENDNWRGLTDKCHKLIGNCGYQGLLGLAAYLKQLHDAADTENKQQASLLLKKLNLNIIRADDLLDIWIQHDLT